MSAERLWRDGGHETAGPADRWVAIMAGTALGVAGLRRGDWVGLGLAAMGGGLLFAGAAGVPVVQGVRELGGTRVAGLLPAASDEPTTVQAVVTIRAGREALFRHWRNFGNLPTLMDHLDAVEILDRTRSCWKARGPGGMSVVWHSEIDKEQENELISWHTVKGPSGDDADLPHRGQVQFKDAPGGRGTEVRLTIAYHPPGGQGGRMVARLFGSSPGVQAREALRRLKQIMETGERPTIDGQPHGARRGMMKLMAGDMAP
ncbi:MAG TPA: SRPBCC family protein [Azospirillum sp.]|nr:SRPBCC family protein [Azospirillum sp.]